MMITKGNEINYKVCIPTAGIGSRLMGLTQFLNKSLLAVANKPILSHIIEKFPSDIEIVIALGYKGELVKEFLELAYPERTFTFVNVKPYEGLGSGLGFTLLQCMDVLQCPFIFCSCDTIVAEKIPAPQENWIGYAVTHDKDAGSYRSIRIENGGVTEVCEKGALGKVFPYIGLAGIFDYDLFWKKMLEGRNKGAVEMGESYALRYLTEKKIKPIQFEWYDTGNLSALAQARTKFKRENNPNILDKPDEAIWFVNGHVIKFSNDKVFIKNRIDRSRIISNYCPSIVDYKNNMYKYKTIEGEVLSDVVTIPLFEMLLQHCKEFWQIKDLSEQETREFRSRCMAFYKKKTEERINLFYLTFNIQDVAEHINGVWIPKMQDILNLIDWNWLAKGIPGNFHGDLHFENILYSQGNKRFYFLDWRQDFGGNLAYGDVYYDIAKLNHGLIINHELISKDLFKVEHSDHRITYNFLRKQILVECEDYLQKFVIKNGYDYKKVQVLTALIFLNIAALHHHPYSKLLYYLGKYNLYQIMSNE